MVELLSGWCADCLACASRQTECDAFSATRNTWSGGCNLGHGALESKLITRRERDRYHEFFLGPAVFEVRVETSTCQSEPRLSGQEVVKGRASRAREAMTEQQIRKPYFHKRVMALTPGFCPPSPGVGSLPSLTRSGRRCFAACRQTGTGKSAGAGVPY